MTRYTLLASGTPVFGILNINILAATVADAREQALAIGKQLHPAGFFQFDLFDSGEGNAATRYLSFRTETTEPTVELLGEG